MQHQASKDRIEEREAKHKKQAGTEQKQNGIRYQWEFNASSESIRTKKK
jgi:hypothetical protein